MFDVIFLGTSGSSPTKERGLPSVALERDGELFLFDCGEGTQMQAMKYSVNISKLVAIFVSHTHGDHVIGIAGLVRTLALRKRQAPLTIFVPRGEEQKITVLLTFDKALIGYPITVKGVGPGQVYEGKGFRVSAFELNHKIKTLGYVFEESERRRFIKEKCAKLGLKGTMFGELSKKGSITIKGKRIKLSDVTTEVEGKKMVYATDTRPIQSTVKAAKDADLLIHESSFANGQKDLAMERFHSTAGEAALIAKKANCKTLVLFHISARYNNHANLLKDAKEVFKNSEVAKDGMKISI